MSLRIQQLYDFEEDKPVRFEDVDVSKFDESYVVDYNGSKYRVYSYNPPKELVKGRDIKEKNHFNGEYDDAPIDVLVNDEGDVSVNEGFITHQLYKNYGEGRFQVWKQGGNPPQERYFKNKFIVKEDSPRSNVNG